MKRHPSLIPLSRDHHEGLIVARYMRSDNPGWKGFPPELSARKNYLSIAFSNQLKPHFEKEESAFERICRNKSIEMDDLINRMKIEHSHMSELFHQIEKEEHDEECLMLLDQFGRILESHIRMEERELFELMQSQLSTEELAALEKALG